MATTRTPDKKKVAGIGDNPSDTDPLAISEQLKLQKKKESRRKMESELKVLQMKREAVERKLRRVQGAIRKSDESKNKHFLQL